jgi:pimeloyl-ACP methyl ester carboxylesterase
LGLSEKTQTGYGKHTVANDIAALIKHLGERSAIVVGPDMGGKVAFPYMGNHLLIPDRVSCGSC